MMVGVDAHSLPIGLHLNQAARVVAQAFDRALHQTGGSLPVWLVLLNLKASQSANQRELAAAVGIGEATLTHHLNAMERDGLITRARDTANRRVHVVALTPAGEELFAELRTAAMKFDRQLNRGVSGEQRALLAELLTGWPSMSAARPLPRRGPELDRDKRASNPRLDYEPGISNAERRTNDDH